MFLFFLTQKMTEYITVESDFIITSGNITSFTDTFITTYLTGSYNIVLKIPITATSIADNAFNMD